MITSPGCSPPQEGRRRRGLGEDEGSGRRDVRVLAFTQPKLVTGVPKKRPELMELRIGGGTMEARVDFAKGLLGKDIAITDFAKTAR